MTTLSEIVEQLKDERDRIEQKLLALNAALTAFVGAYGSAKPRMSAAARKKISLAQKARWAKHATANGQKGTVKPKRIVSASARRRMASAQRARWAKIRAGKKAA
jgi:hypothetical protein